jgi:hypothetical protein
MNKLTFGVTVNVVFTALVTRATLAKREVLLVNVPATLLVTATEIVHEAIHWPIDAPVTVMDPAPAPATIVGDPPQVLDTAGDAATTTPVGKLLVKLMPLCAGLPAPLVKVKVKVEVSP